MKFVPRFPPNLHLLPVYPTDFTMFEAGEFISSYRFLVIRFQCQFFRCFCWLVFSVFVLFVFAFFPDGRHFKSANGKDFVEALVSNSDMLMAELHRSTPDRLSTQQNQATSLQGQIDLLKSHQASQDRLINFALAREAEESDGRINER